MKDAWSLVAMVFQDFRLLYLKCMVVSIVRFQISFPGKSVEESSRLSLQHMADRVRGSGGSIAVSPSGEWAATFTTTRMAWAAVDQEGLWYGLDPNDRFQETLSQ